MQDEAVVAQLIKPYRVAQRSITSTSGAPPLASTPQQPHVAFSLTRICARLFVWGGRRHVGVSEFVRGLCREVARRRGAGAWRPRGAEVGRRSGWRWA